MYTSQVIKHFKNPKNLGKIKNPNGHSKVGNAICGDQMDIYLRVKENKIIDIGFETMGCVSAISTSSMITELARGKTIAQAKKITFDDIAKSLGGLPKIKMHCSHLAVKALQEAIKDYEKNKK